MKKSLVDAFKVIALYYLYQLSWMLTASLFYNLTYDPKANIINDLVQVLHPAGVVIYSWLFLPITLLCFAIIVCYIFVLKKVLRGTEFTILKKSSVFVGIATVLFFVWFILLRIFDLENKALVSFYTFPLDDYEQIGLHEFVFGTILFAIVFLPVINLLGKSTKA